jgi:hypothetical protein
VFQATATSHDAVSDIEDVVALEVRQVASDQVKFAIDVADLTDLPSQQVDRTILEVGCGDGWNGGKLVKAGVEKVIGIDWSRMEIAYSSPLVPARRFWQLARWVDNRYYQIKPSRRRLRKVCEPQWLHTPLVRCAGLIVSVTRTGS